MPARMSYLFRNVERRWGCAYFYLIRNPTTLSQRGLCAASCSACMCSRLGLKTIRLFVGLR